MEEQLKHQEALLKSQLTLEQQKLKALQDEAKLNADRLFNPQNKGYTETSYNKYDFAGGTKSAYDYGTKDTASGGIDVALNQQITNVENLNQRIEKLNQNLEVLRNNGEENSQLAIEYATEINDLNTLLVEEENSMNANAEALINAKVAGYELSDAQEQILERYNALNGVTDSVVESIDDYEEAESEATDAMNDFLSSAESLQSAYESLSKAADEYNKNGIISASTLKKLSKLNPEYIAQLEVVNGKMQVGNGLLQEEFEYEKQLALISIDTAKQLRIQAVCQEYSNDKTQEAKTATQEATPEIDAMASALNKLGVEGLNAARGVEAARAAVKGDEQAEADLNQKLQDIDDWANGMKDSINAVNLGAVESSKSAAGASKDAWVEAFEEEQRLLKHSLEMNEITEYEYYQKLIDLNEKYFGEISGKHQKYLKEYQENEEEIYKGLKSVYDKVANYLKEAIEQGYEDAINAIKKEEKRILDEIKAQIEALKDEKKKVLQDITDQINNLKKKKDKIQDYWNSQIDKIKESNEQLQKQNELLEKQQALQRAKAQKVMVMKGGKFQLSENESAVSQAEQSLSEYEDQYSYEQQISEMEKLRDAEVKTIDDRIEKLEAHKEYMERYYDDQIDALERYRDEVEQQYEKQIDALQEQLDAFKKSCQQQEKLEEARLASQVAGINSETDLFKISLANLKTYVDKYNEIMKARATLDKSGKVSSGGETSANADFQTATSQGISSNADGVPTQLRASGDAYFRNDEVALVGESPNAELVLGSNLNRSVNSGTLVHLAKGSGVVNAESTATLAGLLNSIEPQKSTSIGRSVNQTFTFSNLTLPNVTDADSFVNALSNKFNNYAIQYSNIRN